MHRLGRGGGDEGRMGGGPMGGGHRGPSFGRMNAIGVFWEVFA